MFNAVVSPVSSSVAFDGDPVSPPATKPSADGAGTEEFTGETTALNLKTLTDS